jgi:exopolyphosphatase/guanosine-5'-triphosphate,3'-diphosphate pyrophosphatase
MYARRSLSVTDLQSLVNKLSGLTAAERAKLPGVSSGRAGQLVAGAVVAEAVMDLLDIKELVICPWALREGVILHRMDRLPT